MVFALLAGCDERPDRRTPPERYGLAETALGRSVAESAIAIANSVAAKRLGWGLRGSWQPSSSGMDENAVVYLIDAASLASAYSVMVPSACRCVFIQPAAFGKWMDEHTRAMPQMLDVGEALTLGFMLLHEMGHLAHGDPGEFEAERNGTALNTDKTEQKERESKADSFAVEQVRASIDDKKAFDGWMNALNVSMALSQLSWNMSAMRLLGNFGATSLCARSAFADSGYSHPNFELRLLVANQLLRSDHSYDELIDRFETCRSKEPTVLYRLPPG